ncbi:MFS transporter [SAR202 cluster bacterium AC-647-N09_OGT_505m]|nr:MFS transporter [SAR202 cluster bacterium AC-647-N09_OGT_505m]
MARISLVAERLSRQSSRVFYGWWIVTGGFSLQMIVGSLMIHSFTAYFPILQTQFGWSRAVLSGAFALSRAESGILGPLQGWLIDKFGPRMMVRVGMLMFGAGFILFSQTDSVLDYYITFALMAAGSSIAGFLTVATTVVNWFERRRGVAMGVAMSGFGFGGLLVPAVAWSLTSLGWRPTSFFSGILIIVIGLPIAQIMRQRPEQYGYLPDGASTSDPHSEKDSNQKSLKPLALPESDDVDGFTAREAIRTPAFWLLGLGHSMALFTVGAVSLHLIPHIVDSVGLSITSGSSAVVVMTVFNILGQLGGGFLGDRFSKRWLAVVAMLVHSVALLILAYATTLLPVYIFAVLHGTAWGVRGPMMTTIRADYFGRASFATIMGLSSLIVMVGMTSGPLIAGFLADIFDGYRVGFIVISVITGIGSLFFALASPPKPPHRISGSQRVYSV